MVEGTLSVHDRGSSIPIVLPQIVPFSPSCVWRAIQSSWKAFTKSRLVRGSQQPPGPFFFGGPLGEGLEGEGERAQRVPYFGGFGVSVADLVLGDELNQSQGPLWRQCNSYNANSSYNSFKEFKVFVPPAKGLGLLCAARKSNRGERSELSLFLPLLLPCHGFCFVVN